MGIPADRLCVYWVGARRRDGLSVARERAIDRCNDQPQQRLARSVTGPYTARMSAQPNDLDPVALYAIAEVAEGRTLTEIAAELGMRMGALYMRCNTNAELARLYQQARETAADMLEAELIDMARASTDRTSKADRVKLAALQWIISKRNPRRYAERVALEHTSPDGTMSPKEALDTGALSDAALAELMAARKPKGAE